MLAKETPLLKQPLGTMVEVDNPAHLPDPSKIDHMEEPMVKATIMVPKEYVGPVMELSRLSPSKMIARGGRIPAPMQSLKN